jgi:hypothetical protein
VGRTRERSRFKKLTSAPAHEAFFAANGLALDENGDWTATGELVEDAMCDGLLVFSRDAAFPEIHASLLAEDLWMLVVSRPFTHTEGICVLEARAFLRGLQVLIN